MTNSASLRVAGRINAQPLLECILTGIFYLGSHPFWKYVVCFAAAVGIAAVLITIVNPDLLGSLTGKLLHFANICIVTLEL